MKQQKKYRQARPYQDKALQYGFNAVHPAYFLEMGLGKALIAIRTVRMFNCKKILIAGPAETFYGWQEELYKEHEPEAIELTGLNPKARLKKLDTESKWKLINKEGHRAIPEIKNVNWDMVILDESTFIKSQEHKTKNNKDNVSKFYCKNFRDINHRMILTGLPDPEHLLNYFQQLKFLDPDIFGFMSYWKFQHTIFYEYYYDWKLRPSYKDWFHKQLAKHCFFLKRKEVGLHIEEVPEIRSIKPDKEYNKVYKKLSKEFILRYRDEIDKRTKFAPVKLSWLRQLASGFVDMELKFNGKINALIDLLNGELKGQPIIIYCQFICEIMAIKKRLKKRCRIVYSDVKPDERAKIKEGFCNREFDVLVLESDCWKYGLNLGLVNTMIFFSLPFGLETYEQNKARIKRGKKKDYVLMIYLMLENSVEYTIYKGLQKKQTESELTYQIIKDIVNENTS